MSAAVLVVGDARGCKIAVASQTTPQLGVQHALGNAERVVSVVCNRSQDGDPRADAACEQVLRAIWSK